MTSTEGQCPTVWWALGLSLSRSGSEAIWIHRCPVVYFHTPHQCMIGGCRRLALPLDAVMAKSRFAAGDTMRTGVSKNPDVASRTNSWILEKLA